MLIEYVSLPPKTQLGARKMEALSKTFRATGRQLHNTVRSSLLGQRLARRILVETVASRPIAKLSVFWKREKRELDLSQRLWAHLEEAVQCFLSVSEGGLETENSLQVLLQRLLS